MSRTFINQLTLHRGNHIIIFMMTISFWRLLFVGNGLIEFKELADSTSFIANASPFVLINAAFIFIAAIVCASWLTRSTMNLFLLRRKLVDINEISVSTQDLTDCVKLFTICFTFTALLYSVPSYLIKTTLYVDTDSTPSLMNGIVVFEVILATIGSYFLLKRQVNIHGACNEK
ncbi:hypothetical protein ACK32R_03810 [Aeromonas dhakensis]|uniref:hypothetical protein n=1 Tax=Aeromonas dhakensis TaxID=196024 RepID=UPI003987F95C